MKSRTMILSSGGSYAKDMEGIISVSKSILRIASGLKATAGVSENAMRWQKTMIVKIFRVAVNAESPIVIISIRTRKSKREEDNHRKNLGEQMRQRVLHVHTQPYAKVGFISVILMGLPTFTWINGGRITYRNRLFQVVE